MRNLIEAKTNALETYRQLKQNGWQLLAKVTSKAILKSGKFCA